MALFKLSNGIKERRMNETTDITVVVPVYKNADSLMELSERINHTLGSLQFEIIYVNDCSPDNASVVLDELSRTYAQVRVHTLSQNIGQHKATLEGIKKASGRKVVVMDGDLQDAPELIIKMYDIASSNKDAVFVKRKGSYQSKGRMLTSLIIKKAVQFISGLHYKAGSYYVFDQSYQSKIITVASKCRYPYMSIITGHLADNIQYIESERSKSIGGSGYNFAKRIYAAFMALYCALYCSYIRASLD